MGNNETYTHYEINISKNGTHFFATTPRSLISRREAIAAYKVLKEKFLASEGYLLTVTGQVAYGRVLTAEFDATEEN
ncbi:MAG: hypothetical protein FWD58_06210 [Firmicutes bacterium]|nr:hypothetical protein [Bacillota bacterium]